jgi:uncharacterized protein YndB with AHSA1/START domain
LKNTGTLQVSVPTEREVVLTRVFHAPRKLVFAAMTKSELLKQWYGPRGWTVVSSEIDLKVGGTWRTVLRGPTGQEMAMSGVYREIVPPERIVSTESFDDYPGESLNTLVLIEENGTTTMTSTVRYESKEIRDAVLQSGMEHGAAETFDRLAEFLEKT